MSENNLFTTPILFIIFNRPDVTKRVFNAIREIRPAQLFVSADGPRASVVDEKEKCDQTRKIIEKIDWPCEVNKKYSEKNMGCKIGVSSAINWFFDSVSEGIILEDDCLPDLSFFTFCQELLIYYKEDTRIKMISGDNFQFGRIYGPASYYFSRHPQIWGWATWKRAWEEYDITMKTYPDFKEKNRICNVVEKKSDQRHWLKIFDRLYKNQVDTWDGQLVYAIFDYDGLCIIPNKNLVTNIGHTKEATHTKTTDKFSNIPKNKIDVIIHPSNIEICREADRFYNSNLVPTILERLINKIKSI